jgi:hypothetical protein
MVNARHAASVRPCRSASRYWIDGCLYQLRVQRENYNPQSASLCEVYSLSYCELKGDIFHCVLCKYLELFNVEWGVSAFFCALNVMVVAATCCYLASGCFPSFAVSPIYGVSDRSVSHKTKSVRSLIHFWHAKEGHKLFKTKMWNFYLTFCLSVCLLCLYVLLSTRTQYVHGTFLWKKSHSIT